MSNESARDDLRNRRMINAEADLREIGIFATKTWPEGLPELWVIHERLLVQGLSVERSYRPYGHEPRTRMVRLRIGTMRWLSGRLKRLGLNPKPAPEGEPSMSESYRRKIEGWAMTVRRGGGDVALAVMVDSCNKYLISVRYATITAKSLGMWLRAHGWQLVRRADGVYVLGVS